MLAAIISARKRAQPACIISRTLNCSSAVSKNRLAASVLAGEASAGIEESHTRHLYTHFPYIIDDPIANMGEYIVLLVER